MQTGERDVLWQRMNAPGLEHLRLMSLPDGVLADGLLIAVQDGVALRASYAIQCDNEWRVRRVEITRLSPAAGTRSLISDGAGHWSTTAGEPMPVLEGCRDVDIFPTPFTNTLPIRRLALAPGDSAEIMVTFVELPALSVQPAKQRYTCLEAGPEGARYRYEGLESGFTTELRVDADGLVMDYPGWFLHVWP